MYRLFLFLLLTCSWYHSAEAATAADNPIVQSDEGAGLTTPKNPKPLADLISATFVDLDTENLEVVLLEGFDDCVLDSLDVGIDNCTYIIAGFPIPMICVRVTMNMPGFILESGMRKNHVATVTGLTVQQMKQIIDDKGVAPLSETGGQDEGGGGLGGISISATVGRTMGFPQSYAIVYTILQGITAGNLCFGPWVNLSLAYNFVAEGDDYGWRNIHGGWFSIFSPYVTSRTLAPFTALATVMEYTGIGGADMFGLFTHGNAGTVFPVNGVMFSGSVEVAAMDSLLDASVINSAFFFGYGPLQLRAGMMHYPAHALSSYIAGLPTLLPQVQLSGRMQYLYKGEENSPETSCQDFVRGPEDGSMPAWAAVQGVEATQASGKNPVAKSDIMYAFAYYPRVTCCNYCAGSKEAPGRLFRVGRGFWTQLDL